MDHSVIITATISYRQYINDTKNTDPVWNAVAYF